MLKRPFNFLSAALLVAILTTGCDRCNKETEPSSETFVPETQVPVQLPATFHFNKTLDGWTKSSKNLSMHLSSSIKQSGANSLEIKANGTVTSADYIYRAVTDTSTIYELDAYIWAYLDGLNVNQTSPIRIAGVIDNVVVWTLGGAPNGDFYMNDGKIAACNSCPSPPSGWIFFSKDCSFNINGNWQSGGGSLSYQEETFPQPHGIYIYPGTSLNGGGALFIDAIQVDGSFGC